MLTSSSAERRRMGYAEDGTVNAPVLLFSEAAKQGVTKWAYSADESGLLTHFKKYTSKALKRWKSYSVNRILK
jgi:hypothetical protein